MVGEPQQQQQRFPACSPAPCLQDLQQPVAPCSARQAVCSMLSAENCINCLTCQDNAETGFEISTQAAKCM